MKFPGKLTEHGYTELTVSTGVKKDIKDYHKLAEAIGDAEQELQTEGLSERRISTLNAEIAEGKADLEALDTKICNGIDRYKKNEATYKTQGKRMNDARKSKTGDKQQVKATGITTPAATPAAQTIPAADEGQQQQQQQQQTATATPPSVKKESSGWGWVLGSILALAGIGTTVYLVNKNK